MHTFTAGGKTVTVFPAAEPDAPVVYLNTFGEEGQKVLDALPADPPLTLVAISGLDWDRDIAPWDSPAVFKNAAPFSGGADDYLRLLTGEILPIAERELPVGGEIGGDHPDGAFPAAQTELHVAYKSGGGRVEVYTLRLHAVASEENADLF